MMYIVQTHMHTIAYARLYNIYIHIVVISGFDCVIKYDCTARAYLRVCSICCLLIPTTTSSLAWSTIVSDLQKIRESSTLKTVSTVENETSEENNFGDRPRCSLTHYRASPGFERICRLYEATIKDRSIVSGDGGTY